MKLEEKNIKGKREEDKKWRPVHEIIVEMLKEEMRSERILTLAEIYRNRAKVPLNGLPSLLREFEKFKEMSLDEEGIVKEAMVILKQQEKEQLLRISEEKKRKIIERRQGGTILLEDALEAVKRVVEAAKEDLGSRYGEPVAVAVVGLNLKLVAFAAMDGVMPVSVDLCIKKAYTAIAGQRETLDWEQEEKVGLDGRNFGDPNWTCFGGGVPIKVNDRIIGAVGVSGRCSHRWKGAEIPPQDHELAQIGARYLEELYK